jgi:hypothetical protein
MVLEIKDIPFHHPSRRCEQRPFRLNMMRHIAFFVAAAAVASDTRQRSE